MKLINILVAALLCGCFYQVDGGPAYAPRGYSRGSRPGYIYAHPHGHGYGHGRGHR